MSYFTRLWTFVMEVIGPPNNVGLQTIPNFVNAKL